MSRNIKFAKIMSSLDIDTLGAITLFAICTDMVGILLNAVVLHAFFACRGRAFSKKFMYIINLRITELLLAIIIFMNWVLLYFGYHAFRVVITLRCVLICCYSASIIMTLDLAFAILMPLKHKLMSKKTTIVAIISSWFFGLVFLIPYMLITDFKVCRTLMYSVQIVLNVLVISLAISTYSLISYKLHQNRGNSLNKNSSDKNKQILWVASITLLTLTNFLLIPDIIEFAYFMKRKEPSWIFIINVVQQIYFILEPLNDITNIPKLREAIICHTRNLLHKFYIKCYAIDSTQSTDQTNINSVLQKCNNYEENQQLQRYTLHLGETS